MKLSDHFYSQEFACKCGCGYGEGVLDVDAELVNKLELLREMCGGVCIYVSSGCRCQAHDAMLDGDVGGEVRGVLKRGRPSFHLMGKAADIWGPERNLLRAKALAIFSNGGVGLPEDGNWVHVDVGPQRRWTYSNSQFGDRTS